MIRKFVYAKKPNLPFTASHWTADESDYVTVHFNDGRDAVKLPGYHTPETLVKGSYNRDGDDSIVVESVEPWQAEVERLKGELAIAEKKAAAYDALDHTPVGSLLSDGRKAELLGMKRVTGTYSGDFLAFIKELIAERDAARKSLADLELKIKDGTTSASAWKALVERGDLRGIYLGSVKDEILALVDHLKSKNSGVEEACQDLKAAISDSLNVDGEAIDSASMILAGVRYINGLKSKLKNECGIWWSLRENYGMPAIVGRSAFDDILSFVASLKAKVAESEASGKRIAEALGLDKDADCDAAVERIKTLQFRRDELQSAWSATLDLCRSQGMSTLDGEGSKQCVLRHIRNQETANGHLADEVKRLTKSVEGCVLTPVKNLHSDLMQRFNMPEDNDKNYSQDILAFVEALKKGLDESQREVTRLQCDNRELAGETTQLRETVLKYGGTLSKAQSSLYQIKALAEKGVS